MGGVFSIVNLNVYHYSGNNPVKYIDLIGLTKVSFYIRIDGFTYNNSGYFISSFKLYYSTNLNETLRQYNKEYSSIDCDNNMNKIISPIEDSTAWTDSTPVDLIILTDVIKDLDIDIEGAGEILKIYEEDFDRVKRVDDFLKCINENLFNQKDNSSSSENSSSSQSSSILDNS